MPPSLRGTAKGKPRPQKERPEDDDISGASRIHQISYIRTNRSAKDDKNREGTSPDGAAPSKFFQKSHKKNRKGIPDPVNQGEGDETDAYDDPTKIKGDLIFHENDAISIEIKF